MDFALKKVTHTRQRQCSRAVGTRGQGVNWAPDFGRNRSIQQNAFNFIASNDHCTARMTKISFEKLSTCFLRYSFSKKAGKVLINTKNGIMYYDILDKSSLT